MIAEWVAIAAAPGPPEAVPVHFISTGTEAGDETHARAIAEAYWHRTVFAVRPARCTGLASNVHFGRACPVHPDA